LNKSVTVSTKIPQKLKEKIKQDRFDRDMCVQLGIGGKTAEKWGKTAL